MTLLISYLTAHAIQIAAIGGTLYAVNQAEAVIINAEQIFKDDKK
jgi:hypothetical protein